MRVPRLCVSQAAGYACKRMVAVCTAGGAGLAPSIEPERACDATLPEIDGRLRVRCGLLETIRHGAPYNKNYAARRRLRKSCGRTYSRSVGFEGLSHGPETVTGAINMYDNGRALLRGNALAWGDGHENVAPDHPGMGGASGRRGARIRIRPARKGGKGAEGRRNARQNQGRGELPVLHHTTTGPGSGSTIWRHPTRAQTMSGRRLQNRRIWQVSIQSFSYVTGPQTLQRRPDWNTSMPRTCGASTCGEIATTGRKGSSAASNPREKTMRSLKRPDSGIVRGIFIHCNFVRKHMGDGPQNPRARRRHNGAGHQQVEDADTERRHGRAFGNVGRARLLRVRYTRQGGRHSANSMQICQCRTPNHTQRIHYNTHSGTGRRHTGHAPPILRDKGQGRVPMRSFSIQECGHISNTGRIAKRATRRGWTNIV